jgi:hypothetical protein
MDHWKIPLTVVVAAAVVLIIGFFIINQGPIPLPPEPPAYQASICTDTPEYSLVMSSVPGMRLIPVTSGNVSGALFHWTTNYGTFLFWNSPDFRVVTQGREVVTDPRPVYWSFDPGKMSEPRPPVTIGLSVEDPGSGTVLARTEVGIGWAGHDTAVMWEPCLISNVSP